MTIRHLTPAELVASLSDEAKQTLFDIEAMQRQLPDAWVWQPTLPAQQALMEELVLHRLLDAKWIYVIHVALGFVLSAFGEDFTVFLRDPEEFRRMLQSSRSK